MIEIADIIKVVVTAGVSLSGYKLVTNFRLKSLEKTSDEVKKKDGEIVEKIHALEVNVLKAISDTSKRLHSRIDDLIKDNNKEHKEIRAEYVSESHCNSKMSK